MPARFLLPVVFIVMCFQAVARGPQSVPYLFKDSSYTLVESSTLRPVTAAHYQHLSCYDTGIFLAGKSNGENTYIGADGRPLFSQSFSGEPSEFRNGIAVLQSNSRAGVLLNTEGRVIKLAALPQRGNVGEGMIAVTKDGKSGFASLTDGQTVIPVQYAAVRKFSEGVAAAMDNDGHWMLIDKRGKPVTEARFEEIIFAQEGRIPARWGGLWGYIDNSGKTLIPARYTSITLFSGGRAIAERGDAWYLIDAAGKELKQIRAEHAMPFADGLAPVMRGGRWAFINTEGAEVIAPSYRQTSGFHNGIAMVSDDGGRQFYIDTSGKQYREQ